MEFLFNSIDDVNRWPGHPDAGLWGKGSAATQGLCSLPAEMALMCSMHL